jgi:hypothetical protein
MDGDGVVTERRIANAKRDAVYMTGFDLDRRAERTFRLDRVLTWRSDPGRIFGRSALPPVRRVLYPNGNGPEILFTGFSADQKDEFQGHAARAGFTVRASVTQNLAFLCVGPKAAPAKTERARERGAKVINLEEFETMLVKGSASLPEG